MASTVDDIRVTVGAFEAKTHFSKLLERAHAGEEIVITHRGEPYARLVPMERDKRQQESRAEIFARIRAYARANPVEATAEEIREWIEEGRM